MAPKSSLPYVDELPIEIGADREKTWAALLQVVEGSFASARGRGPARLLACEDTELSGARPLAKGSAFPGFHVESVEPLRELELAGRHRFSTCLLSFRLEDADGECTRTRRRNTRSLSRPEGKHLPGPRDRHADARRRHAANTHCDQAPRGAQLTGWSAIRPVLAGFLLAADALVVVALLASRRQGWLPPFIAFGALLIGLVAFEVWAVRHRHDDDKGGS